MEELAHPRAAPLSPPPTPRQHCDREDGARSQDSPPPHPPAEEAAAQVTAATRSVDAPGPPSQSGLYTYNPPLGGQTGLFVKKQLFEDSQSELGRGPDKRPVDDIGLSPHCHRLAPGPGAATSVCEHPVGTVDATGSWSPWEQPKHREGGDLVCDPWDPLCVALPPSLCRLPRAQDDGVSADRQSPPQRGPLPGVPSPGTHSLILHPETPGAYGGLRGQHEGGLSASRWPQLVPAAAFCAGKAALPQSSGLALPEMHEGNRVDQPAMH